MRNHLGAAAPFLSAAFSYHRKTVSLYAVILRNTRSSADKSGTGGAAFCSTPCPAFIVCVLSESHAGLLPGASVTALLQSP